MNGRPNKYHTNVKPRFQEIENWLEEGTTEKEISKRLGVNERVWCRYKKEFSELNELVFNSLKNRLVKRKSAETSWSVYKHTFPNRKVYIGITSVEPKERWKNGKGYAEKTFVRSAIEKYGWQNVKHEILFTGLSEAEAKRKEIELIKEYNSTNQNYGYNLTEGGEGVILTPEQRRWQRLKKRSFGEVIFAQDISDVLARLDTVEELSKNGHTKDEIANMFGVSKTTWYAWENAEPIIKESVDSGRLDAIKQIKAALFKRAVGFKYEEKTVTDSEKNGTITVTVTKTALPDPASAMILLKHWDKEGGWTQDPAVLEVRKQELEIKKKQLEEW